MTRGNAARAGVRLIVWCRGCGHLVELDASEMAERYGAEMALPTAQAQFPQPALAGASAGYQEAPLTVSSLTTSASYKSVLAVNFAAAGEVDQKAPVFPAGYACGAVGREPRGRLPCPLRLVKLPPALWGGPVRLRTSRTSEVVMVRFLPYTYSSQQSSS